VRVLIDTSYADRGVSGTGIYAEQIAAALRERGEVEVVEARQRRRLRPGGRNPARSGANVLLDMLWLHAGLPRAARRARADVVHHTLPAHSRRIEAPQVATVQDVAFMRMRGLYRGVWALFARRAYARAVRRCEALVCPTRATAADLEELLGAEPARIVVAPYGPGQVEGEAPAAGGEHLLFVGGAEPRKNVPALLDAYSQLRRRRPATPPLVLAGGAAALAGAVGVRGSPSPSRRDLLDLLRGAIALVHPSLHEGFGFTPLEAMALGVPVMAVRNPGTEEVCGDAALLVEPGSILGGLERITSDAALRAELARRGRERASRFSWEEAALAHQRAYTLARGDADPAAAASS
jgi:glycosyltransferase involved in cell wall biosynthesis